MGWAVAVGVPVALLVVIALLLFQLIRHQRRR